MRAYSGLMLLMLLVLPHSGMAQSDDALTLAAKQVSDRFVQAAQAKRGEVAEIDGTTLYVSLGSSDGIFEGQLLQIAAKGDPIVVNGETLGYKETPVAVAEVAVVQGERLCLATVKQVFQGQQPAKGNTAYLKSAPPTLAISSFLRQDAAATAMGTEFSDKLGMALQATGRFRIVERSRLDAALSELKLGLNDLFDRAKAAPLGQMIQAKGVVMGTITQQNDRYTINVRVVDIETGTQVLAAGVTCGRSTELDGKYGQSGSAAAPATAPGALPRTEIVRKSLFAEDLQWIGQSPWWRSMDDVLVGNVRMAAPYGVPPEGGLGTIVLNRAWDTLEGSVGLHFSYYNVRVITLTFVGPKGIIERITVRAGQPPMPFSIPLAGLDHLTIDPDPNNAGNLAWASDCALTAVRLAATNRDANGALTTDDGDVAPMASADALYDPNTEEGR